jgi:hypothetical protein
MMLEGEWRATSAVCNVKTDIVRGVGNVVGCSSLRASCSAAAIYEVPPSMTFSFSTPTWGSSPAPSPSFPPSRSPSPRSDIAVLPDPAMRPSISNTCHSTFFIFADRGNNRDGDCRVLIEGRASLLRGCSSCLLSEMVQSEDHSRVKASVRDSTLFDIELE